MKNISKNGEGSGAPTYIKNSEGLVLRKRTPSPRQVIDVADSNFISAKVSRSEIQQWIESAKKTYVRYPVTFHHLRCLQIALSPVAQATSSYLLALAGSPLLKDSKIAQNFAFAGGLGLALARSVSDKNLFKKDDFSEKVSKSLEPYTLQTNRNSHVALEKIIESQNHGFAFLFGTVAAQALAIFLLLDARASISLVLSVAAEIGLTEYKRHVADEKIKKTEQDSSAGEIVLTNQKFYPFSFLFDKRHFDMKDLAVDSLLMASMISSILTTSIVSYSDNTSAMYFDKPREKMDDWRKGNFFPSIVLLLSASIERFSWQLYRVGNTSAILAAEQIITSEKRSLDLEAFQRQRSLEDEKDKQEQMKKEVALLRDEILNQRKTISDQEFEISRKIREVRAKTDNLTESRDAHEKDLSEIEEVLDQMLKNVRK